LFNAVRKLFLSFNFLDNVADLTVKSDRIDYCLLGEDVYTLSVSIKANGKGDLFLEKTETGFSGKETSQNFFDLEKDDLLQKLEKLLQDLGFKKN